MNKGPTQTTQLNKTTAPNLWDFFKTLLPLPHPNCMNAPWISPAIQIYPECRALVQWVVTPERDKLQKHWLILYPKRNPSSQHTLLKRRETMDKKGNTKHARFLAAL